MNNRDNAFLCSCVKVELIRNDLKLIEYSQISTEIESACVFCFRSASDSNHDTEKMNGANNFRCLAGLQFLLQITHKLDHPAVIFVVFLTVADKNIILKAG